VEKKTSIGKGVRNDRGGKAYIPGAGFAAISLSAFTKKRRSMEINRGNKSEIRGL